MQKKTIIILCIILLVALTFTAGCSKGIASVGLRSLKAVDHAIDAQENEELISDSDYLDYEYSQPYELWGEEGATFDISIQSSGGNIDILVLDVENYIKYDKGFENGINSPFLAIMKKNTNSEDFRFTLPKSGTYYLVVENSGYLTGGADAGRGVQISVSVR